MAVQDARHYRRQKRLGLMPIFNLGKIAHISLESENRMHPSVRKSITGTGNVNTFQIKTLVVVK